MEPNLPVDQNPPDFDDGWWSSILSEEEDCVGTKESDHQEGVSTSPDWEKARWLYQQDAIIELTVTGYNRGGVLVQGEGLQGFVPCSHLVNLPYSPIEKNREECLSTFIHRKLKIKIIECSQEEGRLVFSERAALVEAGKRPSIFNSIKPGQRISGEVTNITQFGVFVDLGGVEGLIHISELSWGRVSHPSQVCQIGQRIEVQVIEVIIERCRIALSVKRLIPNPWEHVLDKYLVNDVVPAVITETVNFGYFARLEEGLEGSIHLSEIPKQENQEARENLHPGQNVFVRILQVDPSRQRMGLSLKI
jgi:small subunit ribosomal protein S1